MSTRGRTRSLPRGIFRNPNHNGLRYGVQWFDNGRRHRILVSNSLAEAVRFRKDIKAVLRARRFGIGPGAANEPAAPPRSEEAHSKITFSEYADRFLSLYESGNPKTHAKYAGCIKVFKLFLEKEKLEDIALDEVSTALINDFIAWRARTPLGVTQSFRGPETRRKLPEPKTIYGDLLTLRTLFNAAIKEGCLEKSPTRDAKWPRPKAKVFPRLSPEELERFFEKCDEHWFPVFYTLTVTGLRASAVCMLQVGDIDFEKGVILQYEKSVGWQKKWSPKGNVQEVPIADDLLRVLKAVTAGKKRHELVFPRPTGNTPHKTDDIRRKFMSITREIGRPDVTRVHSLRKLFSRILLDKGVDISRVSELLGHSDSRTTMTYTAAIPRELSAAVSVFNEVLGDSIPEQYRAPEGAPSE